MQFTPTHMLLAALFNGALSAYLAHLRGRNLYRWFWIGFFFGLFGIFAFLLLPHKKKHSAQSPEPTSSPTLPTLPLTLQGPTDKLWYYVNASREKAGPISHHSLSTLWKAGEISSMTYVWNEELSEWKLLQEFIPPTTQPTS